MLVSFSGYYGDGLNAIVVFAVCFMPESGQPNYTSSKATLWVKAQHEGALPPPCIVRKDPRVPHTARRGA